MFSLTPFQTFKLGTPLCRNGYTCFIFSIARENNLISFSLKYKTAFFLKDNQKLRVLSLSFACVHFKSHTWFMLIVSSKYSIILLQFKKDPFLYIK
jgi:hypothetical protein